MEIIKILPQGLCKGVINAIHIVNDALEDPTIKKPIYMLGSLVHNQNIVRALSEQNVIILDGKSRLEMLDEITSGTVIFTAHGVSEETRKKARAKGLDIIDATCKDVKLSHDIIRNYLDAGYMILYYGMENHPEAEGVLGISPKITLIRNKDDIEALPAYEGKLALATQTTMSFLQAIELHQYLLKKYPQIKLIDEVCNSTRIRQQAVISQKGKLDLIIVVGDRKSNNTRMLKEVAEKEAGISAILVENVEDLKAYDLSAYERIGVTAGASTPNVIVQEIIEKLPKGDFNSELVSEDYLRPKR
jgi:4-hydroxy-3-methylbut-2-enyl diphosphate reductase